MAMWSCAPPRVPTPVSPANGPHAAPLSIAAQYCANASSSPATGIHSDDSHRAFASNTAIASVTTSALELLIPIEVGIVLPSAISTPVRDREKSRATRRATAATYTDQRVAVGDASADSATCTVALLRWSCTQITGSAMASAFACM